MPGGAGAEAAGGDEVKAKPQPIIERMQIVVPSRKRAHNMPMIRELLPSAIICVDEAEKADYLPHVPAAKLVTHPKLDSAAACRNWIVDNMTAPIVVMVDDDFAGVRVTTGSQRYISDPEEILAILENAARCCEDLELSAFCFSGTPNTTIIKPEMRPILATQPVFRVFGVMGAARKRHWRLDLPGRADVDWTLRTLLLDRLVFADVRFFFDCGAVFSGRGGAVGQITPEMFAGSSKELLRTWGKALSFKPPGYVKNREVTSISMRVSRHNKVAQK